MLVQPRGTQHACFEQKQWTEPLLYCSQIFWQSFINTKKVNGSLQYCCVEACAFVLVCLRERKQRVCVCVCRHGHSCAHMWEWVCVCGSDCHLSKLYTSQIVHSLAVHLLSQFKSAQAVVPGMQFPGTELKDWQLTNRWAASLCAALEQDVKRKFY